jgi:hypothetical protein
MSTKSKKKKTVKELRDKHLSDKSHVITEQEVGELDLDIDKPDRTSSHVPDLPEDKDRPRDEDKDPKIITPWDVVS